MKIIASFLFLILLNGSCFAQAAQESYILSLNFEPSFDHSGIIVIHCKNNLSSISLATEKDDKESIKVRGGAFIPLTEFLKTHLFAKAYNEISNGVIIKKDDSITDYRLSTNGRHITLSGSVYRNNKKQEVRFALSAKYS